MEEKLKETGKKELIVIGCMTHLCLSTFVRAAAEQYGYQCTVVGECTATRDLPHPGGNTEKVVAAKDVQSSNLAALSDFFATVVPSVDDIKL
jgi:nicotinamidase-related amidase